MKKCKNSVIFSPSIQKSTIWSYSAAKNISRDRTFFFFFFYGEGREEIVNHKEATRMRSCKTEI